MGFSQYPTITDELLSAYIDDAVNAAERAAVEEAAANDSEIAWRLESLQHTVSMLGQLTDVPLPRSFTLNDALVEAALAENHSSAVGRPREVEAPDSLWNKWLDFWRSGSPIWRNAAAACALLLMVVLVGGSAVIRQPISSQQSQELAAARSAEIRPSLEQTTGATAPGVADTDGETASASVAIAPESAPAPPDQAGPEPANEAEAPLPADAQPIEQARNAESQSVALDEASDAPAMDADLTEAASASTELQVESPIDAGIAATDNALQEEPSAILEPLAAPAVLSIESAGAESTSLSDPASAAAPEADQLIAASTMEMRATLPSEDDATEDSVAGDNGARDETIEGAAEIGIAEPLPAPPSDSAAAPLEAESMPDAVAVAAVDPVQPTAASVEVAMEQPGTDQGSSDESAPEEAVMQEAPDEEALQDQEPQGGTDSVQPSAVAMADSAQDADPAPEAVLEEVAAPEPSGQSSTEDTAVKPLTGGVENAINSMSLLGILAIVLTILTLVFFSMWLRSRSRTATRFS